MYSGQETERVNSYNPGARTGQERHQTQTVHAALTDHACSELTMHIV